MSAVVVDANGAPIGVDAICVYYSVTPRYTRLTSTSRGLQSAWVKNVTTNGFTVTLTAKPWEDPPRINETVEPHPAFIIVDNDIGIRMFLLLQPTDEKGRNILRIPQYEAPKPISLDECRIGMASWCELACQASS